MGAATIISELRAAGYLPALIDGKVRLYGDTAHLDPDLREALCTNRGAIVAHLCQPGQSVAYDLIDMAAPGGWHPRVNGGDLQWGRGDEHTADPMPTPATRGALLQHGDDVIAVLLQVPEGCRERGVCQQAGICQEEITESSCTTNHAVPPIHTAGDGGGEETEMASEGAFHHIWTCAACDLPRSGNDRPCPNCGAVDGYEALRPAKR